MHLAFTMVYDNIHYLLKIGQYLTKLHVEYRGLLSFGPPCIVLALRQTRKPS